MNFEEFVISGKVRLGYPDIQHAKSLIKMSDMHNNQQISIFWKISINNYSKKYQNHTLFYKIL